MRFSKAFFGIALFGAATTTSSLALADKPADDFLNPQDPGPRLSFMTIIGPGFRANYDHRHRIEQDISELRTQLIGDVVVPFSEIGAHVDIRLFLLTFGVSVGYHNEWRLLEFQPDYQPSAGLNFGRDYAGVERTVDAMTGVINPDPPGYADLTREARRQKDHNADVSDGRWPFFEGRVGFIWPAQGFILVSTAALRHEDRPDVSYDWVNGTPMNGGFHMRWETYGFFRNPSVGFIGPALRVLNVPRNRLSSDIQLDVPGVGLAQPVSEGDACQNSPGIPCNEEREFEVHYGFIGGLRTNWITNGDVFLTRVYTTLGQDNDLFGTHVFGWPIQILVAYQVDVEL